MENKEKSMFEFFFGILSTNFFIGLTVIGLISIFSSYGVGRDVISFIFNSDAIRIFDIIPNYSLLRGISNQNDQYICRSVYVINVFSFNIAIVFSIFTSYIYESHKHNHNAEIFGSVWKTYVLFFLAIIITFIMFIIHIIYIDKCIIYGSNVRKRIAFSSSSFLFTVVYGLLLVPSMLLSSKKKNVQ